MTRISILGCGWLGLPLAKALLKNNYSVNGSTTTTEKLTTLENSGIKPFLISLSEDKTIGDISEFLSDSKILILDVPPKLRGTVKENYVSKIKNILPFIEKSEIENVIFVSSTAVYGESVFEVNEATTPNPITESGKQLLESESLLQSNHNFKTTVLRFGGLIGENRHPARFLAGKTNLENPDTPINLIHLEDCIGIIQKIIEQKAWNESFNAVTPFHPSRKEYYTQQAFDLDLTAPLFSDKKSLLGKTISSSKIETVLEYRFQKPKL